EGYEYGSFHFLEPSFLHNYTDSTCPYGFTLLWSYYLASYRRILKSRMYSRLEVIQINIYPMEAFRL
ncbi:hypothetical protein ABNC96_12280, partial [Paenibacillus larvae]